MKNLREGEVRFIARQIDKLWRVYDRARGSYPYSHPDLGGTVVQDVEKSLAEAEAERLNGLFVKKPKAPKLEQKKGASKGASETETEAPAEEEVDIPELPDYGVLSEEEAARYEEGLMEEVKY